MEIGDLVQILPTKIGYYIIVGKTKMREDYGGYRKYWDLATLCNANFDTGGPMDYRYIGVVSSA